MSDEMDVFDQIESRVMGEAAVESAVAAERARIRRELEAELLAWTEGAAPNSLRAEVARSLGAVLKRVCPE